MAKEKKEQMELWQYLASLKATDRTSTSGKFADKVGVSRTRLSRIVNYRDCPSIALAMRIEEETSGKVSAWDLILKCVDNMHKEVGTQVLNMIQSKYDDSAMVGA